MKKNTIFYPKSNEELQQLLHSFYESGQSFVVIGAETSSTGATTRMGDSVCIDMRHFNRILDIDTVNKTITCEASVITGHIQHALDEHNLFYPPDPGSLNDCFIAGNIATNAGGPRCLKYGVTRQYVLGISGFYPDGTPFTYGGKTTKDVTGYSLKDLLIGSEGTLAVMTAVTLKVITKPLVEKFVLLGFDSMDEALAAFIAVRSESISPSCIEFFDECCFQAAQAYYKKYTAPFSSAFYLLVGYDGNAEDAVDSAIQDVLKRVVVSRYDCPENISMLWDVRRSISPGLKQWGGEKVSHDIAVPSDKVPEYIRFLQELSTSIDGEIVGYGHFGDGNIHVNILKRGMTDQSWNQALPSLEDAILRKAVACGGTISGEHGIGLTKKRYMSLMYSDHDLKIMKQIKATFDPKNLLNPGKII